MSPKQDKSQPLTELLEQSLKQWHTKESPIDLTKVLPNLIRQTKVAWQRKNTPLTYQTTNQLLYDLLEDLAKAAPDAAKLLRQRYIDDETGFAVANSMGISESFFYRRRREALLALTEVAITNENEARLHHINRLENRLEKPSYHQLFGLNNLRNRLSHLICQKSDIKLFCLAGIGGIGKTSLADTLAREVISKGCFDEFAWISARREQFTTWGEINSLDSPALTPAELITKLDQQLSEITTPPRPYDETLATLKTRLTQQSYLIILDNLETAADYQELLPILRELGQFAWILVTSRVRIHKQADVHITNLSELSLTDVDALIRDEAFRRGIDDLAEAPAKTITQIYDVVGGNPLALKLIIGQVQVRSLSTVLSDLKEARGQRTEALYNYIYQQAWNLLDNTARRVLLIMPLVAMPGATLNHLIGATKLNYDDLDQALNLLIRLSLLNVGGTLDERRYYIHRLTETFLHTQVTKWGEQV